MPSVDWSHEETNDPLHADRRNFYKVEKWSRDGQRVEEMLFAGEQPIEGPAYLRAVRDVNVPVAFLRSAEWQPDLKTCAIKRTDLFRQSRMYHRQNLSECSPEFAYYPYFFDVIGAQVTDGGKAF